MSEYNDDLLHHEYDGIHEYDNPMPSWWKWTFLGTIIWSVVYVAAIGLDYVWDYGEDLRQSQKELAAIRQAHEDAQPPIVVTEDLLALASLEPAQIESGRKVFAASCASCHGNLGQGMIGPNLADDHWIYGGSKSSIHKVILNGAPNGMPAWGSVLPPQQMVDLVAFVSSIQGTNPEGGKPPQGERYSPVEVTPSTPIAPITD